MARAWVDMGTGRWGPVQHCLASLRAVGYTADRFGLGGDVLVLVTGPGGPPESLTRPAAPSSAPPVVVGAGPVQVTLDARGRPADVLDDLGETWSVDALTGVWVRLGPVSAAVVRTAWRVRLICWHTPPPGVAAVLEVRGSGSWRLRPPQ